MTDETKFFYTNGLEASVSPYDVSLKFFRNVTAPPPAGTVRPVGERTESRATAAETLVVSMSPTHAKAIIPSMIQLIEEYENTFGPLPLPPEIQLIWDRRFQSGEKAS